MRHIGEAESLRVVSVSDLAAAPRFALATERRGQNRDSTQGELQSPHRTHQLKSLGQMIYEGGVGWGGVRGGETRDCDEIHEGGNPIKKNLKIH